MFFGTGNSQQNLKNLSGGNYTGFHYAATGVTRSDSTTAVTVRGDGSSTINIYYDRDYITMNFHYKRYTQKHTIEFTGLYGQTLGKYNYTWPANDGPWKYRYYNSKSKKNADMYMTFLGQFILPGDQSGDGDTSTIINFTHDGSAGKTYYFYLEKADGTWPSEANVIAKGTKDATTFNFYEKFDNFNVSGYQLNNGGKGGNYNPSKWYSTQAGSSVSVSNANSLGVRYSRRKYKVEFYNNSTHLNNDVTKYYEADLSDVSGPTAGTDFNYPSYDSEASSYTFVGWFADDQCTTYVSFGKALSEGDQNRLKTLYPDITNFETYETMPGSNLRVYAGWKAIRHTVTFDPQGGTIPGLGANQQQVESVLFGQKVRNATASNVQQTTYTDSDGVDYTLVGWYKVDPQNPNDRSKDKLYNFGDAVTEDITLMAHWRQSGQFYVKYVDETTATTNTTAYDDTIAYADQSEVKAAGYPSTWKAPDGYVFAGWQLATGTDTTTYIPGQTFRMEASQTTEISGRKYITLKALYTQLGTTYITYDANEGTGKLTDPSGIIDNQQVNVPLNQTTTLSNGTGFSREGYVLAGWNTDQKSANAGTVQWNLSEIVGIGDQVGDGHLSDGGNKLYAVWRKPIIIKKVDSSDSSKTLSDASFKLTKESGDTYVNVSSDDFYGSVTVGTVGYFVTTGVDGTVSVGALKDGSYKLIETEAPNGYIINNKETTFTVSGGKVSNVEGEEYMLTITNEAGKKLPSTGGSGTLQFMILGLFLILGAGFGYVAMKNGTSNTAA